METLLFGITSVGNAGGYYRDHLAGLSGDSVYFRIGGVENIQSHIQRNPDNVLLVLRTTQGRIVAALEIAEQGADTYEVSVSVSKEYEGNGYARRLIQYAIVLAYIQNRERLVFEVNLENIPMNTLMGRYVAPSQEFQENVYSLPILPPSFNDLFIFFWMQWVTTNYTFLAPR